jgi:poly(hydroxyalkanoate) granule-associated protein
MGRPGSLFLEGGSVMAKAKQKKVSDLLHEGWLAALGAFSLAENEAKKLAERITKNRGFSKKEAQKLFQEILERVDKNRKVLETKIEEGIERALRRLGIPTQKELNELKAKVDALAKKVGATRQSAKGTTSQTLSV